MNITQYLQEGEEYKELKEHPGYYITNRGRVWSMKSDRFLSISRNKLYHYKVNIKNKSCTIHTLVGRNFLPEYKEGLCILHHSETLPYPQINYVENLWVGTRSDNSKDMWNKNRNPDNIIHPKQLTEKQVRDIREEYNTEKITHKQLGERYGVSTGLVSQIVTRKIYKEYH